MAEIATRSQVLVACFAVALIIGLIVLGTVWYGFSKAVFQRIGHDISERPGGPMAFRFVLQPVMSLIAALHDGIKDARIGRASYFWTVLTNPAERGGRLREGLISTGRIILLGVAIDAIYQSTVLKAFYPGETVIITILLAFVPYLLLRGPIARAARRWMARKSARSVPGGMRQRP